MTRRSNTKSATLAEAAEAFTEAVTAPPAPAKPFTPFQAAKVVNEALKEAGIDKTIPSQMMYNYTTGKIREGKQPVFGYNPETKVVDRKSFDEWLAQYISRQLEKLAAAAEAEQAEVEVEAESQVEEVEA